ncbi:hypothetical protein QJS66_14830 [Kocuria rhizophila]|nr:hypothetical protein QJS66_14830 [Kocuria rhizophila]
MPEHGFSCPSRVLTQTPACPYLSNEATHDLPGPRRHRGSAPDVLEAMWPWLTSQVPATRPATTSAGAAPRTRWQDARERVAARLRPPGWDRLHLRGRRRTISGQGDCSGSPQRRATRTRVVTSAIEHHAVGLWPRTSPATASPPGRSPCTPAARSPRRPSAPHCWERRRRTAGGAAHGTGRWRAAQAASCTAGRTRRRWPSTSPHPTGRHEKAEPGGGGGLRDAREQRGGHAGHRGTGGRSPPARRPPAHGCRPGRGKRAPPGRSDPRSERIEPRGYKIGTPGRVSDCSGSRGNTSARCSAAVATNGVAGPEPPPWRERWVSRSPGRAEAEREEHAATHGRRCGTGSSRASSAAFPVPCSPAPSASGTGWPRRQLSSLSRGSTGRSVLVDLENRGAAGVLGLGVLGGFHGNRPTC